MRRILSALTILVILVWTSTGLALAAPEPASTGDALYLRDYYELGSDYLLAGKNEEALSVYQQAVSIAPDDAEAHVKLGDCYAWIEQPDDAIREYERSLELRPEQAEAHRGLAQVYSDMGEGEKAVDEWKTAMAVKSGVAADHLELGDLYNNLQRFSDAVEEYMTAVGLDPKSQLAHSRLGWGYSNLGRHQDALEQGRAVLALTSSDDPFWLAQGHLLAGVGLAGLEKYPEAIDEYREALKLQADFHFALYYLGLALADSGRTSEAWETYELLKAQNPAIAEWLVEHLTK